MLTELTQTAIAVLCDISAGSHPYRTAQLHIDPEYLIGILTKLETGGWCVIEILLLQKLFPPMS